MCTHKTHDPCPVKKKILLATLLFSLPLGFCVLKIVTHKSSHACCARRAVLHAPARGVGTGSAIRAKKYSS